MLSSNFNWKKMKLGYWDILLQEVPGEISLGLAFSGCNLRCKDCHSEDLWDAEYGEEFNVKVLTNLLNKYKGQITCVCFLGGEHGLLDILEYNKLAKSNGLKTCLYTGLNLTLNELCCKNFDFIKTGPYIKELGGLRSRTTNQRFFAKINDEWVDKTSVFFID